VQIFAHFVWLKYYATGYVDELSILFSKAPQL